MGYWRLSTSGAHFTRLQALGASAIAIAPDGTFVAEAKHGVSIERLRWFKRQHVVPLQPSPVNALAIRPDSKQVAAGHGKRVTLFAPLQKDGPTLELSGHAGHVLCLAYSPNGATLSGGGKDGIVIFWDAATGSERLRLDLGVGPIHGVAFSPDGLVLAVAGDHGLVLIDVE
jgi:WD40 repeat protein